MFLFKIIAFAIWVESSNYIMIIFFMIAADGLTYSWGIFQVALVDDFKCGEGPASWIISILVGVTLCSGKSMYLEVFMPTVRLLVNYALNQGS